MSDHAPLARLLCDSLKTVNNRGAALYNDGRPAEALRLYQGALFVVLRLLGGLPDLKRAIADGLQEVEQSAASDSLKAYRLHEVIDHARDVLKTLLEGSSRGDGPGDASLGETTNPPG